MHSSQFFVLISITTILALGIMAADSVQAQLPSQDQSAVTQSPSSAVDSVAVSANELPEVMVTTGNPLGSTQPVTPVSVLTGENLLLERGNTLGETLENEPGVANSYFGPNAGRPVIRGLDGDRIRILQNGSASTDVSALSYDHNTPIDPLVIERVEVLRGPAALLYGGSAQGGVVNVIDNRIPREPVAGPEGGISGRLDASYTTGRHEKNTAGMIEGGNDHYALHADAFYRYSDDVNAPVKLECDAPRRPGFARRICNSQNRAHGGAAGGSLFFDHGYLGASAAAYRSEYGTPAEDNTLIDMHSERYALEGLWRNPIRFLESIKGHAVHSDYRHTEIENGTPGTIFKRHNNEVRLEARHRRWGNLEGTLGFDWSGGKLSALGEEAFIPPSHTNLAALFSLEELHTGWGKLTFGGRIERVRTKSLYAGEEDQFATGARVFHPVSAALGGLVNLGQGWALTGNLGYTERAPKDYELFANGPHVATGTWETGDPKQRLERSGSLDAGARWERGPHRFAITAFTSHYRNFIGLMPAGGIRDNLPVYTYTGVKARFSGFETSSTVRLFGAGSIFSGSNSALAAIRSVLDLDLRADMVHAQNRTSDEPLPLIPPVRIGATLRWSKDAWGARIGFDHAMAQKRVPDDHRTTGAYTLWNAALTYRQKIFGTQLQWYARAENLTNRLAYSATSILTQTSFPAAPLPGRSIRIGLQASF